MVSLPRRPRTNRQAIPIAALIGQFMQARGFARGNEHRAVFAAWERVVPRTIGARTRAVSFRNGKLIVAVTSAPLFEELHCFRSGEFLALLNHALTAAGEGVVVRKVEFRRG